MKSAALRVYFVLGILLKSAYVDRAHAAQRRVRVIDNMRGLVELIQLVQFRRRRPR